MAVLTQLEKLYFSGKRVFHVVTHEESGLGSSKETLEKSCKGAVVCEGLDIKGSESAVSEKMVSDWARRIINRLN